MAIKSLMELQKGNLNYTPYANYYDVSNRYNVPQSLSEYILTNYTLGWGNGSARYLSYSNSELDCSYAEQDDITLIPIQRSTITKLAVKFMCTGLNSQWGIFDICLVRFDGNTQINSDRKFLVLDGHIADQSSSNINQWYNYEFNFDNFEADYIGFATGVVGWKLDDFAFYISENANGGGATHIAKRTGQLKDLSSYTSDILIVSGGGGGGYVVDGTAYAGADAGGISGSGSNSGNQSTGYAFGQGESGTNVSGGGGGLYGGYKGVM